MKSSDIDLIVNVIRCIRDWNQVSIRATLEQPHIMAKPVDLVLHAAILCARDPRTLKPPRIGEAGDWWTRASNMLDPTGSQRPLPPPPDQMCICGRPQHDPNPACDEPRQAIRQRPPTRAEINAGLASVRRSLRERKATTT